MWIRAVKLKPKVLRHFKVDPVLKIDETFYKQAESMWEVEDSFDVLSRFALYSLRVYCTACSIQLENRSGTCNESELTVIYKLAKSKSHPLWVSLYFVLIKNGPFPSSGMWMVKLVILHIKNHNSKSLLLF